VITVTVPGAKRSSLAFIVFQWIYERTGARHALCCFSDVVAQMGFTGGGFHGDARHIQCIVRTVHTALGGGLLVLLNSHDGSCVSEKGW
jgi:hypothetical protein